MLYLQGAREGMNKFVIMYMKGELLLQTLHNAERRSDEIFRYFHTYTPVSDGKYPHPTIIPRAHNVRSERCNKRRVPINSGNDTRMRHAGSI